MERVCIQMNRLNIINNEMKIDLGLIGYSVLFKVNILNISVNEFNWLIYYIRSVKKLNRLSGNGLCDYLTGIPTKIDLSISPQVSAFDIDITH